MLNHARARRRSQRGAVLVETTFMMPMFIILFFASLHLYNLNAKQISLNITTREAAWAYAMSNCGQSGENDSERTPGNVGGATAISTDNGSNSQALGAATSAIESGSVSGAMSGFLTYITSALASVFPNPQGAQSKKSDTFSWRQPNLYAQSAGAAGTNSSTVKQTVVVYCNVPPQDGSLWAVISDFMGFVTSLI